MKKLFVLFAACALVAAFTLPAMAESEWSFYGNARMQTFWEDWDRNANIGYMGRAAAIDDDDDMTWDMQSISRFGALVSAGDISGKIEIGLNDDGIAQRPTWGQWDFGAGKIRIGYDWRPDELWNGSGQRWWNDNALTSFGYFYATRSSQIQFTFDVAGGSFQFAFVEPYTAYTPVSTVMGAGTTETDTEIPVLSAHFTRNFGPIYLYVSGFYQTYNESVIATERDYDIDSWMTGICLGYDQGPFYAYGAIYGGENLQEGRADMGFDFEQFATYDAPTDSIIDVDRFAWSLVAGFRVNDMITFEAGYGQCEDELDQIGNMVEDEDSMYYLNCQIQVAEGFSIVPEIGKYDLEDRSVNGVSVDRGDITYFGAKWQIDF